MYFHVLYGGGRRRHGGAGRNSPSFACSVQDKATYRISGRPTGFFQKVDLGFVNSTPLPIRFALHIRFFFSRFHCSLYKTICVGCEISIQKGKQYFVYTKLTQNENLFSFAIRI